MTGIERCLIGLTLVFYHAHRIRCNKHIWRTSYYQQTKRTLAYELNVSPLPKNGRGGL